MEEDTHIRSKGKVILSIVALVALVVGLVGGALLTSASGASLGSIRGTISAVSLLSPGQAKQAAQALEVPAPAARAASAAQGMYPSVDAARKAGPAVVTVVNSLGTSGNRFGRLPAPGGNLPTAEGSGVIIDKDGHIVTNAHVVDGGTSFQVIYRDGTRVDAKLVGKDTFSDLAVLKVDAAVPAVAELGDSSTLQPGEPVIAIGSALGQYRNSVTSGIVSAVGRRLMGQSDSQLTNLIQTDAPINHGNSGGPLVNMQGQVVGITTAVVRGGVSFGGDTAEGLGFAIPSNTAGATAQELISSGSVTRPYLGIQYQTIDPQVASANGLKVQQGALVADVVSGGPADKAGVQKGDVIFDLAGQKISQDVVLGDALLKHKPGDKVRLLINRDGSQQSIDVTLGERPNS